MENKYDETVYLPLEITVTAGDPLSESVTLRLQVKESSVVYDLSADFVGGIAFLSSDDAETPPIPGIYSYQFLEYIQDKVSPYVYPDASGCEEGDCDLPIMTICPTLPEEEGS